MAFAPRMYAFFARRRRSFAAFCMLAFAAAAFSAAADAAPAGGDNRIAARPGFLNFFSRWQHMAQPPARYRQRQVRGRQVRGRSAGSVNASCLPPAIKGALADVQRRFGPATIISAHRNGARIRGSGRASLHATCQAVDFRPAPGTYAAVASHLRRNWQGGLGTYSSGHIHIDTGANYRWHHGRSRGAYASTRRR